MNALGIIPARGGSKGVLRKNLRPLAGRPLIEYTIRAASNSKALSRFVLSTDDMEIAEVGKNLGAPIIIRPPDLGADDTPMIPVVQHALSYLATEWDYIVLLQPTAPLRNQVDIDEALQILDSTKADSVVSVYRVFDQHPSRMYKIIDGRLVEYAKEPKNRLRQSLPPVFHRNGAIYACRSSLVLKKKQLIGSDVRPYIMPRERSINIDDELDLAFAEYLVIQGAGDIIPY